MLRSRTTLTMSSSEPKDNRHKKVIIVIKTTLPKNSGSVRGEAGALKIEGGSTWRRRVKCLGGVEKKMDKESQVKSERAVAGRKTEALTVRMLLILPYLDLLEKSRKTGLL